MIIGLDLGGTKIAGGIVRNGKVVDFAQRATEANKGKARVIANIRAVIDDLSKGRKIAGVGIGVPGTFKGTRVTCLTNIRALDGIDLKRALEITCPVALENDARCFTLAEHRYGAIRGARTAVGVVVGTGLGTGIIIDGRLYRGAGSAGELSRVVGNPLTGMLPWEHFMGGTHIVERHHRRGGKEDSCQEIWESRSRIARVTREETVCHFAMHMANLVRIYDPAVIVFGGGVSRPDLVREARKRLPLYIMGVDHCPRAVMGRLKHAGVIGAALASGAKRS